MPPSKKLGGPNVNQPSVRNFFGPPLPVVQSVGLQHEVKNASFQQDIAVIEPKGPKNAPPREKKPTLYSSETVASL